MAIRMVTCSKYTWNHYFRDNSLLDSPLVEINNFFKTFKRLLDVRNCQPILSRIREIGILVQLTTSEIGCRKLVVQLLFTSLYFFLISTEIKYIGGN